MRARLQAGASDAEIAAEFGVARSTAHRLRIRMGKKPGAGAAYRVVSTRLTDREAAILDSLLEAGAGKTRGAVLRKLVRHAGGMFEPSVEEEAFLTRFGQDLARLGGNFNQIAAALSASMRKIGRAEPSDAQIDALRGAADQVSEIRRAVVTMLRNSQARASALEAALVGTKPSEVSKDV